MLASICSRLIIFTPKTLYARRTSLHTARGIISVAFSEPFYGLLTNLSDKQIFITKHMIIVHELRYTQLVTPIEATLLESGQDTGAAVLYKLAVYRDT